MRIMVLGSGLVGGPMALDLAGDKEFHLTVVDKNADSLARMGADSSIQLLQQDLSEPDLVRALVADYDMVINAVPGFMGFQTLKAIIEAGKNVVDIAFFPEDPFALDELARQKGVVAVTDCGVSPGMSNILIGHVDHVLDRLDSILIYVGGLPEVRQWPYEYKAVFSPLDVIEEYTRPARYVENGKLVIRPALSDPEYVDFPRLGTLEAFNSDGLRTLIRTMHAPNMKEKTLRYPGHIEKMAVLRETGFFSQEEMEIKGVKVRPLDFTAKLLFPKWELKDNEADLTVLRVIIQGEQGGESRRYTYDLLDRYDAATATTSMARTTGYTATMAVRMMARGLYNREGISPPEFIGAFPECVEFILQGLKKRGIEYEETVETLPPEDETSAD